MYTWLGLGLVGWRECIRNSGPPTSGSADAHGPHGGGAQLDQLLHLRHTHCGDGRPVGNATSVTAHGPRGPLPCGTLRALLPAPSCFLPAPSVLSHTAVATLIAATTAHRRLTRPKRAAAPVQPPPAADGRPRAVVARVDRMAAGVYWSPPAKVFLTTSCVSVDRAAAGAEGHQAIQNGSSSRVLISPPSPFFLPILPRARHGEHGPHRMPQAPSRAEM